MNGKVYALISIALGAASAPACGAEMGAGVLEFYESGGWEPGMSSEEQCWDGVCVKFWITKALGSNETVYVTVSYTNSSFSSPYCGGSRVSQNHPNDALFSVRIPKGGSKKWQEQIDRGTESIYVYIKKDRNCN